ncbi:MAG: HD domain-containing protein [Solirubrobacteraceae bacterium]|nr:HD domain-containing protein [Solirubrobacteraceae bacterium]
MTASAPGIESATYEATRLALAVADEASPGRVWLVGGAIRDVLIGGVAPLDLDLAVDGDPSPVARAVADALGAPRFPLSDRFGGFRVTAAGGVQVDVMPLHPDGLEADLLRRDLTVNALALPLGAAGAWPAFDAGALIDLTGGRADLAARVLRVCSPSALEEDPLRVLRISRAESGGHWTVDGETARLAQLAAPALASVAGERIGAEVRGILFGPAPLDGLASMRRLGGLEAVLPEIAALDGVGQGPYHHLDVGGHTREVLEYAVALETDLASFVDDASAAWFTAHLDDEVAGGMTVRECLRLGALLHDVAKPQTRHWFAEREMIGFPGHDKAGRVLAAKILERLRMPRRVIKVVQGLTLHHLRLGFLVHAQPLDRGAVYDYLRTCEPVEVEVTVLGLADRLATRGRRAEPAIEAHAALTRLMLPEAISWREAGGAPEPLLDGTALVDRTGRPPGAWLAGALEAQRRARYIDPDLTEDGALAVATSADDAR